MGYEIVVGIASIGVTMVYAGIFAYESTIQKKELKSSENKGGLETSMLDYNKDSSGLGLKLEK